MIQRTLCLGVGCSLLVACGPGGSASTGVGNPRVISLSIVTDDDVSSDVTAAAGGASDGSGGASDEPEAGAAGATESAAGAGDGAAGGSEEGADDVLPRGAIHHAVLVLAELRWRPCEPLVPVTRVKGPFVVDLVAGTTAPRIPPVDVPAGGFCGLDAPLGPATEPPELAGRSLFFDGVRSDGTVFVLYADVAAVLRVRRREGFVWSAESTPAVLWALRPRRWLTRRELDTADTMPWDGGTRAVVIDVNRHPLLLASVRRRLAGKSTFFSDLNRNGALDSEDRSAVVGDGSDDPD